MTRQTAAPLSRVPMNTYNRRADDLAQAVTNGQIDLNPPYQRGPVWTADQRIAFVRSLLSGIPIPTLVLNARGVDSPIWLACIDGKQRLLATAAWFAGDVPVPASWFPTGMVAAPVETDDGLYVTFLGLTERGQALASRAVLPIGEAMLSTVEEEAAVYLLVNGGGTPQTDADMVNARRIAEGTTR
jgi:hypothetical protein